uniref:Alpha-2-macroglobulin-like n=1 Tax=Salmo trutta TaxID=8032 RepID=A0A673Z6X6_SALTR
MEFNLDSRLRVVCKMIQSIKGNSSYLKTSVPPVTADSVATVNVSIKGRKDEMSKMTKILIKPKRFLTIFQTDKPVYKPGQTVKFRIVSLDASFLSFNQMDPNSNRIAQWLNQSTVSGILDLSHPMSAEATQGSYIITAWNEKGEQSSQNFDVKEYVLPKYEVKVYLPQTITILDKRATLRVCGKYTYGKPVLGSVTAKVCRNVIQYRWLYESSNICELYLMKVSVFYSCYAKFFDEEHSLLLISCMQWECTFSILDVCSHPLLCFQIKVTGPDSTPVPNEPVYLFLQNGGQSENWTLTTDSKGIASFSLDTSLWTSDSVSLSVSGHSLMVSSIKYLMILFKYSIVLNQGELTLSLQRMPELTPFAQVVVYTVLPDGEAVADSRDFPIQLCLKNKVSLKFSSLQELPGEKTSLSLQAHPGSLCSLRAIDQSVLLLQPEQELSLDSVRSPWPASQMAPYVVLNLLIKDSFLFTAIQFKSVEEIDAPVSMANMMPETSAARASDGPKETVRTYFPETWIWDLVPVGHTGKVNVEKTVPDTITEWAAGAFCTSPVGFGLAPNTGLTAFQPFFVSLTLPYSVIRGEVFTLKATVFNYLSKCIMVKVTLAESNQFTARPCEGCQYSLCLCAEESRTFKWILTPTALGEVRVKVSAEALKTEELCGNEVATVPEKGRIDTVVQTLLVEVSVFTLWFICLASPEGPVEKDISLKLPEVFVEGSAKASLSVLGDLMGRAMKNLDSLLQMPYGCGEQNMVLFAPNIYILNYLQSTRQLTMEIQTRATGFLDSGYQRELNYKHDDGSYSAFGKSDDSGNTWLTSFVMKSFGGAKPYIFVDPAHIAQAKAWLASHQQTDGCIASVGKLFHNGMKGGVGDEVSLTAYITAALLELDGNTSDPMVEKSLVCLKAAVSDQLDNTYTMALLSYTFTLAQNQDMRAKLITHLDKIAATSGGNRHWERAEASGSKTDSLEVEMTSYVLLALLSGPTMPGFGLDYSTGIVRWLAQQQNPYGGFASTQDTVVALQALAKYGAATFSPEGASTVSVSSAGGLKMEFTVNQNNRLLYQEKQLGEVPGDYNIKAQGKSCVFVQVRLQSFFPLLPLSTTCTEYLVCVQYNGRREETNMVIINVKLLSGFVLDKSSLRPETKTYSLAIEEDVPVRNLKPAVVKVYDYYQTSKNSI